MRSENKLREAKDVKITQKRYTHKSKITKGYRAKQHTNYIALQITLLYKLHCNFTLKAMWDLRR